MDSSETGVGDCSVGSIVWVQRRNGSWWPGKILGPEELSSSHITSPRSGTPVKLLGREDASVDWYNIEKSKHVKAFRCGEFDDCIERAEAAQVMPPKKREKYARREKAILHALELERQLLEKNCGKLEYSSNGTSKISPDAVTSSVYMESGGGNERLSSVDQKNVIDQHLYKETVWEGNQLSGEDDNAGGLPRMRGLQDFGLRTVPTREDLSGAVFSAKRSRHAHLSCDSGDYSNDCRIQPSQTEILYLRFGEDDCSYPTDMDEDHISGFTEDTETDCSETGSMESDLENDMDALSGNADGSASIELQHKYRRTEAHEMHGSISSCDDLDELTYADESSHPFPHERVSTSVEVSKWQVKGKRKNRDAESPRGYINGRNSNWTNNGHKTNSARKSFRTHTPVYGSIGLHNSTHNNIDLQGLNWNIQPAMGGYWEDFHEYFDPSYIGGHHFDGRIMLVDVDLKVQASNYRRDVSMISLTSKLNGHAIVGHPIEIETLDNSSSENFRTSSDCFFHELLEGPASLPRAWRTGRRTAHTRGHGPRLSKALGSDNKQYTQLVDIERANITRKGFSQYPVDMKFSGNSPETKIRTLSSIASEQKLMKTECVDTTVACIPVNLVFSRLHEDLE